MANNPDTTENPSTKTPTTQEQTVPFPETTGPHSASDLNAPRTPSDSDRGLSHSTSSDDLGGLVDPDLAQLEDGT